MSAQLQSESAVIGSFRAAIANAGLVPPTHIIADGKIHRFASNGKPADTAGWYVLHLDAMPAGKFGCWRDGSEETWRAERDQEMSPAESRDFKKRIAEMTRQREEEEKARHEQAALAAAAQWKEATGAPADHPYLVRKGVASHGLRVNAANQLVVAMKKSAAIVSLQFISEDGEKRFLSGGEVKGCYYAVGTADEATKFGALAIAEGFATAASIYEATGIPVLVAFSASNLLPIAETMRQKFPPPLKFIIAADDDYKTNGNPGFTKAREAAAAINGVVAVPDFGADRPEGATDFNDLARSHGASAVERCILAALREPEVEPPMFPDEEPLPAAELADAETEIEEPAGNMSAETDPTAGIAPGSVTVDDFFAYMPEHKYIFKPTRGLWPNTSVNALCKHVVTESGIPMKPTKWLDEHRHVEQMTWAPGEEMLISGRIIDVGGWVDHPGCTCFNLYRPPKLIPGSASKVGPWLDHLRKVYPDDLDHIIKWLAFKVQNPGSKINHALFLGGDPGIGKDSILEPVKYAVGNWNFQEVAPKNLLGRFNAYVKSVILRVSEVHDLGEFDRFSFYEHMKTLLAAPPDVLRCDEKNIKEHAVPNVCGVIITSNYKTNGIYLPADDRRHYIAWSELTSADFGANAGAAYFKALYDWCYQENGNGHVSAYLREVDLSDFNAKAAPLKTSAFWDIVDANRAPEDAEISDAIDKLAKRSLNPKGYGSVPDAITKSMLVAYATEEFAEWLKDRKYNRQFPHRLESSGYVSVRNEASKDRQWEVHGRRQAIYARKELSIKDRYAAALALANEGKYERTAAREGVRDDD